MKMRFKSIIPSESPKHWPFSGLNGSSLNDLGKESLFENINLPLEQEQIQTLLHSMRMGISG